MKKTFAILMALMVLCFSQCKRPVDELTGRKVKVRCTIPINKGSRSDLTNIIEDGSIKWSTGTERIYLALPNETNSQIVELTAFSTLQSSELAFEGEVDENLLEEGEEYEVWYLGNSKNLEVPYITENKDEDIITSISGSIAEQSGSIEDLGLCHIARVSVTAVREDGEIILPLRGVLKSHIAIAYLDLEGVEELSGAAIKGTEYSLQYNESANKYDFVVTENATATINVTNGTSKSFVVLLPNENNNVILKSSKGGYEFKKGVESNKFYYRYISNVEKGTLRWEEMEEDDEPDTPDSTAPKNLVATATGQTTILLKWDAVQNATSYKVYSNDDVVAFGLTEPTYTVENLTAGINYCYYVTAVTEAGESEPSAEACATTEVPSTPNGVFTVNDVTFTMIEVEGNGNDISDYYIGETEVTQALWQAVMGTNPSEFSGNPQRPVEQVSWNKCQEFITKLNELTGKTFRLPTDAEWLYAAKGGNKSQGYTYSGSNNVADVAWYVGNCYQTQNVKTKSPNELGIYDMSGNVAEWTSDIVTINFNFDKEYHHFRGGAYCLDNEYCKVTYYSYTVPATAARDIGFRLCLSTITNPGQPEEPTIPEAPTNLVATATGQTAISLTWDAVPNATSYNVYSNGNVVVSGFAQTTYIVKNLTPGIQYCYEVKAVNEAGKSEASESACATTEMAPIVFETYTVNGVSFKMIEVVGGTFTMGHDSENFSAESSEEPHTVTLTNNYSIGETEVTRELWQAVMGNTPTFWDEAEGDFSQRPVEWVSWEDCQVFITKLNQLTGKNFRLPTEAEWEYAARGGHRANERYKYSGSNNIDEVAWYLYNGPLGETVYTNVVKTKKANELGIYDMSGNVWEWCNDWYDDKYYWNSPGENPQGPESGTQRVYRGGSWQDKEEACRAAKRRGIEPNEKYSNIGLRLCL